MKKLILLLALCATGLLTVPAEAQTSNTFVRFRFSYGGTIFGDVEVELFDQDKPVTVSNFLHYVRSGGYANTWLHRAYPALTYAGPVIIQGGGFRLLNPLSLRQYFDFNDCAYEAVALTNASAAITNESQLAPVHANDKGTLAMATTSGDPNSARSSWFFNLVNNPSFNTDNGGYAVFGRVIKDPKNVLPYFRSTRLLDGIIYEFPVAMRPVRVFPVVADFFVVDVTELTPANRSDASRPTVAFTLPTPVSNERVFTNVVTIAGTATDAGLGLSEVRVYATACHAFTAIGTSNWNFTISSIPPGTNTIEVQSVDAAGNRSLIKRRTFVHVVPTPVGIVTNGSGSISGLTNGQMVEVGRNYVLTSKPAPGHLFAGWRKETVTVTETNRITNGLTYAATTYPDRANSNVTYIANFVPNPFPPLAGTYIGLFYHTNFFLAHGYSGAVKFTLTSQGKFTGSAQFGNKSYPFSGTFHPATGSKTISFKGPGGRTYYLDPVRLNLTNNMETITGVIWDSTTWASAINARRVHSGTTANPSPYKGSYTWMAPGEAEPTVKPSGDSFGKFTVSKTGTVTFSGTMADGTPVSGGGPIGTNGVWGLRAALYSGNGSILSWVTVDTNRLNEDLFGTFYWFHPALPKAKFYTNAFTATTSITGSRYIAPVSKTNSVLPGLTYGVIALVDGNLAGPQTNLVVLGLNNVVTNQSTNQLTFTLSKTTGLFSGTVAPTNQTKSVIYKGAILQKQGYGTGFHLDTNKSGRVYFGP